MRRLSEMVCGGGGQLYVPPSFPRALKLYAKAAIRTQPYDLLAWSAAYFRALADGRRPPAKARLEYPLLASAGGLTHGYIKLLLNQFAGSEPTAEDVRRQWKSISLDENEFDQISCLAGVFHPPDFVFYKFVAVAAGFVNKSLTQTMIALCELYTEEPDGGSAAVPVDLFVRSYSFLASVDASRERRFLDGRPWDSKEDDESTHAQTVSDDSGVVESSKSADTVRGSATDDSRVATNADSSSDDFNVTKQQSSDGDDNKSMDNIVRALDGLADNSHSMHRKAETCVRELRVDPRSRGVVNPALKGLFDGAGGDIGLFRARPARAVTVPAVPGVGPPVDANASAAFARYARETAAGQRDLFMPRNVRHYLCPPLQKL